MKSLVITLLIFSSTFFQVDAQIQPKLVISKGVEPSLDKLIELHATVVLRAINNSDGSSLDVPTEIRSNEGADGFEELKELVKNTHIKVTEEVIETDLLVQKDQIYEIRGIPVEIDASLNEGRTDNDRELVLLFNNAGQLLSVRFALEKTRYQKMLRYSVDLTDELRRKQILSYVEQFRTAYNRKDLDYIETQFSEKALIISGVKIKKDDEHDGLKPSYDEIGGDSNYKYLTQTKNEYIERLRNLFKANSFIDVKFDGVRITRHPDYPEVYGVNLFQVWNSQRYSDEGYLFLMIDYEDENRPLIYVRAWHEKPIVVKGENKVIDMSMFDLIK
ncbi:hypothetical protein EP331_00925 [bacterium]|nr:MAG: hypothetical protein EP331_00925 [bacterium]